MPPSGHQENWEKPTNHNPQTQTQTQQDGKKTKTNEQKQNNLLIPLLSR